MGCLRGDDDDAKVDLGSTARGLNSRSPAARGRSGGPITVALTTARPDRRLSSRTFHISEARLREGQLRAVDHSARTSMKSAASCVTQCELQIALIIGILNAHGGRGLIIRGRARLRVVIHELTPVAATLRRHIGALGQPTANRGIGHTRRENR